MALSFNLSLSVNFTKKKREREECVGCAQPHTNTRTHTHTHTCAHNLSLVLFLLFRWSTCGSMRENKAWIHVWKRQMDVEMCVCVCVPVCVCVLEWRWDWQCAYLLSSFSVYLWNLLCICLWSPLSVSLSIHLCLFVPLFLTLLCLFVPISPSPPTSISPPKHCHALQNSQIISNTEQTHSFQHRDSERVFQMCVQSVSNLTWLNRTQTEDKRMLWEHWWQADYLVLFCFIQAQK